MPDNLVPGYRFYPTEEELLSFYLRNKLDNRRQDMEQVIPVADVYSFDPWQLPPISGEPCRRDREQWFFFCPRQEREAHGGRRGRTTPSGYWKATGSPSFVYSSANKVMGVKKTMVFYRGRAPTGSKTKWKMNEYRALEDGAPPLTIDNAASKLRSEFSLCRIYTRSGCIRAFDRRPSGAISDEALAVAGSAAAATPMHGEPQPEDERAGLNKRSRSDGSSDSTEHRYGGSWRSIRQRGGEGEKQREEDEDGEVMKMIEENDWDLLDWF